MPFRHGLLVPVALAALLVAPVARARLLVETQIPRGPGALAVNARAVLGNPAIRRVVSVWLAHPGARLVIRPPRGVFGRVWADALRSWLVALGIPAERIRIRPALGPGETLLLEARGGRG